MNKLDCIHVDTCLPDYWDGHHLAHIQIPVHNGMTLKEIKERLHSELNQGAVMGSEPLTMDDSGADGDKWYKRAHAAVNRIKPTTKGQRRFFTDLEEQDDDCLDSVYAFFVFTDA